MSPRGCTHSAVRRAWRCRQRSPTASSRAPDASATASIRSLTRATSTLPCPAGSCSRSPRRSPRSPWRMTPSSCTTRIGRDSSPTSGRGSDPTDQHWLDGPLARTVLAGTAPARALAGERHAVPGVRPGGALAARHGHDDHAGWMAPRPSGRRGGIPADPRDPGRAYLRVPRSIQQIELADVLDDEGAVDGTDAVEPFRVVVDDEEAGAGGFQPVESQVGRPPVRTVVVLDQALHEH